MGKGPRSGGSNRCQQPFSERIWVGNEEVSRVTKVSKLVNPFENTLAILFCRYLMAQ